MSWNKRKDEDRKYREKLDFEQQIQDQLRVCREAFNSGEYYRIKPSVHTWQMIVTPDITDLQYDKELDALDKLINETEDSFYDELIRREKLADCPDVVEDDMRSEGKWKYIPSEDQLTLKFQIVLNLFQRKKLLLQHEDNENL